MRLPAKVRRPLALLFAGVIAGVHGHHLLVEKLFHRLLDLNLVRAGTDPEDVLVQLLAQERSLFRQGSGFDDVEMFVHYFVVLPASCSSALPVTKILSKARSCSVFTSVAVASSTG